MAERSKCRRTKERRIGHIIDKVIEWRKYYSGAINEKNQQVKYSLEDAAREVKISKKSLDDYLFQIRFGHRYGFNFNEHYNDKVGVLRDFVRQRKKVDKTEIKARKVKNNDKEEEWMIGISLPYLNKEEYQFFWNASGCSVVWGMIWLNKRTYWVS